MEPAASILKYNFLKKSTQNGGGGVDKKQMSCFDETNKAVAHRAPSPYCGRLNGRAQEGHGLTPRWSGADLQSAPHGQAREAVVPSTSPPLLLAPPTRTPRPA